MALKTEREALDEIAAQFRREMRLFRAQLLRLERLMKDYARDMRRVYALTRRPRRRS